MPLELIDDGYSLTGTAKAKGYPDIVFKFRPALPEAVRQYIQARDRAKTGPEEIAAAIELLDGRVISWDVVSRGKPGPVPVTPETLRLVPDPLLQRMIDVVTGYAKEAVTDEKN